jgi:hypothetical protein
MAAIDEWINPIYLADRTVRDIKESIEAKPIIKYAVLDNFFNENKLNELIKAHHNLSFSVEQDRVRDGKVLPYDGAVKFAQRDDFGADLFFDHEWHRYCAYLTGTPLRSPAGTEIKLRYHRPNADGFWIHTDSVLRDMVIISYFNKGWKARDGGLLQLWRVDEELSSSSPQIDNPNGRLDCLVYNGTPKRISTRTPGGGFPDNARHDLVLVDQIVPTYNRVFLCDFKKSPAYHSVTPSNGKARTGFVQWLFNEKNT